MLAKLISPPVRTVDSNVVGPVIVIGPVNEMLASAVTTLPSMVTEPAPVWSKGPEILKDVPDAIVREPELSSVSGPSADVEIDPARSIVGDERLTPDAPVDVIPEFKAVVPVPLATLKEPTITLLLAVTSTDESIAMKSKGAVLPTGPLKTSDPVQGLKLNVKLLLPEAKASTVLLKVMVPAAPQE